MKMVHAHFPITALISKDKKQIEIKNFLGGKKSHLIKMQEGCTVSMSTAKDVKNELIFEGIDNAKVSLCCAQINGVCKIKQKDERKFLDGIFVSSKELVDPKDDWSLQWLLTSDPTSFLLLQSSSHYEAWLESKHRREKETFAC